MTDRPEKPANEDEMARAVDRLGQAIANTVCVGCGCSIVEAFGPDEIPVCRACYLIGGGDE